MTFNEKESYSKAISRKIKIPLIFSKLLYNRGIKNEEDIFNFFLNEDLSNPFLLPNLKQAVDRILKAIDLNEKIIVYGDYDVDGMMSSCLLFLFLKKINANVDIFIPQRKDGYGLSKKNIERLVDEEEVNVIITVDNGITAKGMDEVCLEKSVDLIITDHHDIIENKLPKKAFSIVNPKMISVESDLKYLAGAGVSYFLVRAINSKIEKKESLIDYKVLAALATISDMVPLIGNNRVIVKEGLSLLLETNLSGLNILLDSLRFFYYPNANDIAFNLIPILNSAARMERVDITLNLLTENNLLSYKYAEDLKKLNEERKKESNKLYDISFLLAKKNIEKNKNVIILEDPSFKEGFNGLIANKISEEFLLPTIVFSEDGNKVKASGRRGFTQINLLKLIEDIDSLLINGGGHQAAIGFSFNKEKLELIKEKIYIFFDNNTIEISKDSYEEEIEYNEFIIEDFINILYKMEPFGINNPAPIIKIKNIPYDSFSELKFLSNNKHFKMKVGNKFDIFHFFLSTKEFNLYKEKMYKNKENITITLELFSKGLKLVGYVHSFE